MPEFAKPSKLGGYKQIPVGEGSLEWSHAVLTRKEYYAMKDEVWEANHYANTMVEKYSKQAEQIEEQAAHRIKKAIEAADARIAEIQEEMERYRAEAEHYRGLNETLLWMNKKRANADRDLRPKAEHTGYAVLHSSQRELPYYTGTGKNRQKNIAKVWETALQTPFSLVFSEEQVCQETKWLHKNENGWLIGKLGINAVWDTTYEQLLTDEQYAYEKNTWFRTRYRINAQEGYWELLITHTKCITGIPPEMMPAQKKKKAGKKEEKSHENE